MLKLETLTKRNSYLITFRISRTISQYLILNIIEKVSWGFDNEDQKEIQKQDVY